VKRRFDLALEGIDELTDLAARLGGYCPETFEQRRDRAVASAQEVVVEGLEVSVGGGGGEPRTETRAQRL
jgi:hypothetical protein